VKNLSYIYYMSIGYACINLSLGKKITTN